MVILYFWELRPCFFLVFSALGGVGRGPVWTGERTRGAISEMFAPGLSVGYAATDAAPATGAGRVPGLPGKDWSRIIGQP